MEGLVDKEYNLKIYSLRKRQPVQRFENGSNVFMFATTREKSGSRILNELETRFRYTAI